MKNNLDHINIVVPPESLDFSPANGGGRPKPPMARDRGSHGRKLTSALSSSEKKIHDFYARHQIVRDGCYIEFIGEEGYDFASKSLENLRAKDHHNQIRIVTQKETESTKQVVVYVPLTKIQLCLKKINSYIENDTPTGNPKHNKLMANLNDIKEALFVESFWQDPMELLPTEERKWCEVWLTSTREESIVKFEQLLTNHNIPYKNENIVFRERAVKLVNATKNELSQLAQKSDDIAEFRVGKATAAFWTQELENQDQEIWAKNLLDRVVIGQNVNNSICALDTGINNGHLLITPLLDNSDCLSVKPAWGTNDHEGHGTKMAGLLGYGNLQEVLESSDEFYQTHVLESVKLLPPNGSNPIELWGSITSQAVSRSEISKPGRNRLFCMAIASSDDIDKGRPSSWSSTIDNITSGAMEPGKPKRLFIICAGDVEDEAKKIAQEYPALQIASSVLDPAQSWNALTIGAYTQLTSIKDPSYKGFECVAPKDSISPFTTTSLLWKKNMPFKPDLMFEGGNVAYNPDDGFPDPDCNDLALLTTYHKPYRAIFCHMNETSASTALAANFAARLQAKYPDYWPETIRGLMVHSADWSDEMLKEFPTGDSKTGRYNLLRICGYGIPNLEKAMYSADNRLTLIAEKSIQPFGWKNSKTSPNEMHLYELPWPKIILQELPENTQIEMRVTLSYFIEPSPGEVGWENKYRYPSFNLSFELNSPGESKTQFAKRINKAIREQGDIKVSSSTSNHWYIGRKNRQRGSIHKDIWKGTPQELASSNILAVFPQTGWWKDRHQLGEVTSKARYSLIVSIDTPAENVNIYTPVKIQVRSQVPIEITT